MLVAIGVPLYGDGKRDFWSSLQNLQIFSASKGIATHRISKGGCYIHDNRNRIVEQVLKDPDLKDASHILWLDTDMYFQPDLLVRLLRHNKSIVVTNAYRKGPPYAPVVTEMQDGFVTYVHQNPEENGEFREVDASGLAACLISRKVFEKVPFPWFHTTYVDPSPKINPEVAKTTMGKLHLGEDTFFYRKAKKHGYKVYCDFSIKVGHIGDYIFDWRDYERNLREAGDG